MIHTLVVFSAGAVVGFLIGLTGMGGGALMTPFLILVMKMDPVLAVGSDLTFAAVTKMIGSIQHRREKNVSARTVLWMACGSLPASILGAQIVLRLDSRHFVEDLLPHILGTVLIVVSLSILVRVVRLLGPKENLEVKWPSPVALIIVGAIGGFLVGMTSIGGGTVIMALLLIFFSIPLNYMVGMDVVHGALLATVSSLSYAIAGQVDWSLVLTLLAGSIPGVWLGARTVAHVDRRLVRGVLAILIMGVGVHLLVG